MAVAYNTTIFSHVIAKNGCYTFTKDVCSTWSGRSQIERANTASVNVRHDIKMFRERNLNEDGFFAMCTAKSIQNPPTGISEELSC